MYPYELALQRQAEIRAAAARHRVVREGGSRTRPTKARMLLAWARHFRLSPKPSRADQA